MDVNAFAIAELPDFKAAVFTEGIVITPCIKLWGKGVK